MKWHEEIIEKQKQEWQKQLNKIKQIKKIKKFNKKNQKIIFENNQLTQIGTYIILLELLGIS